MASSSLPRNSCFRTVSSGVTCHDFVPAGDRCGILWHQVIQRKHLCRGKLALPAAHQALGFGHFVKPYRQRPRVRKLSELSCQADQCFLGGVLSILVASTNLHAKSVNDPLQGFERTLRILAIPGLQSLECFFDLSIHLVHSPKETHGNHEPFVVSHFQTGNAIPSPTPRSTIVIAPMKSMLVRRLRCAVTAPPFFRRQFDAHPLHAPQIFLSPLPANCIYGYEVREMQVNSRVQEIWLRLLGAVDSSPTTRIERVEEGYYAVVHEAARPDKMSCCM